MTGFTSTQDRQFDFLVENALERIGTGSPTARIRHWGDPGGVQPLWLHESTTSYRSGDGEGMKALTNSEILEQAGVGSNAFLLPYDNGHPFYTEKWKVNLQDVKNPRVHTVFGWTNGHANTKTYTGPIYLTADNPYVISGQNWLPFPDFDLNSAGANAIKATVPTRSIGSIAEFIAQLISGQEIPQIVGKDFLHFSEFLLLFQGNNLRDYVARFLRAGGGETLNIEFGYLPFISDIKSIITMVTSGNKYVKQLIRDDGKPVRRTFEFPFVNTTTIVSDNVDINDFGSSNVINEGPAGPYGNYGPYNGKITTVDTYERNTWFSGEYMYHLPSASTWSGKFDRYIALAQKLTGFEITPEVIWDLAPWSWLGDWFADFGTVISNGVSFSDLNTNLVLRYGYLMCHEKAQRKVVSPDVSLGDPIITNVGPLATIYTHERKQRIKATPFGFGFNLDSLSPTQIAILGSLGFTSRHR